jgi:signal transduction histidine kinase/CheY-like chemotaxis protein/HPt (histidine-containing phosphotransfer) domain-containing protein
MGRRSIKTRILFALFFAAVIMVSGGCGIYAGGKAARDPVESQSPLQSPFSSFLDIPGVTAEEIKAVEALRGQYDHFTYGMIISTEAFLKEKGEGGGYAALLCEWLTGLFEIRFQLNLLAPNELIPQLNNGEIDFAGNVRATTVRAAEEYERIYYMTDTIMERQYKRIRLAGSRSLHQISMERPLRYAFLEGYTTASTVALIMRSGVYETLWVKNFAEAYEALKNGDADAFVGTSAVEAGFVTYGNVYSEDFFPLIFSPISMATAKPELRPVISVINKALRNGARPWLVHLYSQGYHDYMRYKMVMLLDDEERTYINSHPVIPVVANYNNYPDCFYNTREEEWQGIFFDLMNEVSSLTGLSFNLVNDKNAEWSVIYEMLKSGEAALSASLLWTKEGEEFFIWSETTLPPDYYALISRSDYPNITINEIPDTKIGVGGYTATMFKEWFPNHANIIEYASMNDAVNALQRGEVDMALATERRLLLLTHYLELPGYKANIVFDQPIATVFAFNKNEDVLCSIIDKALHIINTNSIADQWMRRTYDYRAKVAEARMPWLIGATTLSLVVLLLLLVLFYRRGIERKRLIQHQAEVEAANRAKSSFLAAMSHEMRTPMNAILGLTEIQLQDEGLPLNTKNALHIVYNSGYSLLGVLNNLLDLSKIESGKLELINDRYETAGLINDAVNLNMARIGTKPIEFRLDVDEDMPLELIGDELRLKQILNNLLSNAIKYTDSGEVRLSFAAEIINDESVTLTISVRDTGQGMTEEQVRNLFDAYSRFNTKVNRMVEGTGLGMNIVRQLMEKMNGNITVNSVSGKGTEIIVCLTQGYAGSARLGGELAADLMNFRLTNMSKMKKAQIVREYMPYGKVLVVDDMETNLYVARGFLQPYGLTIDIAFSGIEAIEKIEQDNEYDLIFMDHMMPEMDGIEAVKIIREKGYRCPIVALTANAISGQADIFMKNGFDGFISKPIDIRELNAALNKFVRDRQSPEVIEEARAAYDGGAAVVSAAPRVDIELVKIFTRDAEKAIAVLQGYEERNAYGNDDLRMYIINVHALRSALANVGELNLSGFAQELEQAGREKRIAFIAERTVVFLNELRAVIDKLKPYSTESGTNDISDEDRAYVHTMLLNIKEACMVYDKKAAKAALKKAKQRPLPPLYGKSLDTIADHLLHSDFDHAVAVCTACLSDAGAVKLKE